MAALTVDWALTNLPVRRSFLYDFHVFTWLCSSLHSAKGGAVETGCSDLYGVIYQFTM